MSRIERSWVRSQVGVNYLESPDRRIPGPYKEYVVRSTHPDDERRFAGQGLSLDRVLDDLTKEYGDHFACFMRGGASEGTPTVQGFTSYFPDLVVWDGGSVLAIVRPADGGAAIDRFDA